jgi:L-threonylcarbamoyladenylate synthase
VGEDGAVSRRFACDDPDERAAGLRAAASAARRGRLVVLPTDTVYGVGADAFSPDAVGELIAAKGRGRSMPVPVLVGSPRAVDGLVLDLSGAGRALAEAFWPGALTLVCREQPSLAWDLGETRGTVAVRMPLHPLAVELLGEVGPMAVSSANRSGSPPATTVDEAQDQLGDAVAVYLDGGACEEPVPSSIVDLTGEAPLLLREGAVTADVLREVAPDLAVAD